jgi:hypothetical protein
MIGIVPLWYPVSAAHTSIFRMDSNSTSYCTVNFVCLVYRYRGGTVNFIKAH